MAVRKERTMHFISVGVRTLNLAQVAMIVDRGDGEADVVFVGPADRAMVAHLSRGCAVGRDRGADRGTDGRRID
jgi:hypothetical protein